MNSSRSKLIAGCWIATHPIEIYCNVGNPQLFYTSCTGVEVFCWAASILQGGDLSRYFNNFHYYFRIHLIRSNISCVRSLFTVMLLYKVRQNALFCCIYFINKYRIDCSVGAFCNTFDLHLAIIGLETKILGLFLSGRLRQVLLYLSLI